jgi:hypothetical protein
MMQCIRPLGEGAVSQPDTLGKTIVDYVPYRRSPLWLKLLFVGSGAAALWFVMKQIEPHMLVPLLSVGALTLSLYSLTIFFRLLWPGQRLTVYEQGLVLGRKIYRWAQIEKVSYQLELPSRHEIIEYERHKFWLHLTNGTVELLSFENNYLPSHVDTNTLLEHLRAYVPEVDLADEPKMRREERCAEAVQQNPDVMQALWATADGAIEAASKEGISPRVVAALREGEQRQAEHARQLRRSAFACGMVSRLMILVTIIMTLAGFYTAMAVLFQVATDFGWGDFDLFDVLGVPGGVLRYGIIGRLVLRPGARLVKQKPSPGASGNSHGNIQQSPAY